MSQETAPRIAKISILGLFGAYDYILPGPDRDALGETVILYGDNGCGKTTILQLVFHMLSSANDRGHRGAIAKIPFMRFEVEMSTGVVLTAERTGETLIGPYTLVARHAGEELVRCRYDPQLQEAFTPEDAKKEYLSILESLGLLVYFLSDERQILSDTIANMPQEDFVLERMLLQHGQRIVTRAERSSALQRTVTMVSQWISRQAARGANEGDDNVNSIYTEIVRRLAEQQGSTDVHTNRSGINATLRDLSVRSEAYAKYRFISPLRADQLVPLVNKAPEAVLPAILRVLEPYIDGTKARLDALEEVQRITSVFVTSFADFYSHKRVEFDVVDGLRVYAETGRQLAPEQLSSGERQLLQLFCYTLVSRDKSSIFIIDEPELSLNIKWQRKLIRALNALVEGTGNQFLFATHSMEILAQHRRAVVQLQPSAYVETAMSKT